MKTVIRRAIRLSWLSLVNLSIAVLGTITVMDYVDRRSFNHRDVFEVLFEVAIPIVGLVLEAIRWRWAKWVNVGTFAIAAAYWLFRASAGYASDPLDYEGSLAAAVIFLTVAAQTLVVYWITDTRRSVSTLDS